MFVVNKEMTIGEVIRKDPETAKLLNQYGMHCTSCPDAIARVVKRVDDLLKKGESGRLELPEGPAAAPDRAQGEPNGFKYCPDCGAQLEHEGGCVICRNCGYSKCN